MVYHNTFNNDTLFSLDTVPDPTDFPPPPKAPGLRQLDSALRCNICRDLFEAPVILQCGHCFCSICIRSALSTKQECPSCLKPANDGHLRTNPAMEEAVASWKEARAFVLRLSKEEELEATGTDFQWTEVPETPMKDEKSRRKRNVFRSVPETPRKDRHSRKRTVRQASGCNSDYDEEDPDDDFHGTPEPSSDPVEEDITDFTDETLVECPVCQRRVRLDIINAHIDNGCQSTSSEVGSSNERRSKKSEWSKILGGARKDDKGKGKQKSASPAPSDPLPKVPYTVMKDRQLKDLLTEHKLSTSGDRNSWIARHQRWVMIYNANLDKSENQRKTIQELRSDLKKWEEDRKTKKSIVGDVDAYQRNNRAEFDKLIEAARPKKRKRSSDNELEAQ